jgi:DNA-binding response OmpR family regulator
VPVIAVSARTDLLARAAELADAVVAKPFDIEELLAKISAARRRSCPGGNVPTFIASARTCQHAANGGGLQKRTISAPP